MQCYLLPCSTAPCRNFLAACIASGSGFSVSYASSCSLKTCFSWSIVTVQCYGDCVCMTAAKEIQLQHRAAVVSVAVIDRAMQLLGSPLGGQLSGAKTADMSGGHQVVICSEQQIKVRVLLCLLGLVSPTAIKLLFSWSRSNVICSLIHRSD